MIPGPALPGLDPDWSRSVSLRDADGIERRWHVLDNGAEPTVGTMLCVHGNPTWSYLWRRFVAAAPPGWRVVAPDQLGMGWSDRVEHPRPLATRVDDLSRLTESLGVTGPTVVVAHDWGGPISLGWSLAHVDQLHGIVLTNTAVALTAPGALPPLIRLARSRALLDPACLLTPAFVRGATALSRPALDREVRRAFAAPYGAVARRRSVRDFVADIPLEPDHPSAATLDRIADGLGALADVPVLMLWGARDPVFTENFRLDLERRLPQAVVHRYPAASHLVTEDVPETAELAWSWVLDRSPTVDRDDSAEPEHAQPGPAAEHAEPEAAEHAGSGPVRLGTALSAHGASTRTAIVELHGRGPAERRQTHTSWAELERRVAVAAADLRARGVRAGDRVALLVPPGVDLTVAAYASWRVGAAIVVADAGLGLRSLGNALRSAAPAHVIGLRPYLLLARALGVPGQPIPVSGLSTRIGEGLPEPDEPSTAEGAVLFTSGATGPPKGVVYRHPQLRAQLALVGRVCGLGPEDRLVAAFAPFALYGPALGIAVAVPAMDVTRPGTLTATALATAVAAVDGTAVFASPAALRNVVATAGALTPELRAALGRVRRVLSAGAPVPVPLLQRVADLMPAAELHTPYGMTEALPVTDITLTEILAAGADPRAAAGNGVCVGRPLPEVDLRLAPLDPLGRPSEEWTTAAGVTGEIQVSAAHVKDHYDRLWATERAARADGWHRTGDVGHLDDDGRLWVEGRLVHVLSTADGPLTPVGIEQRLESAPGVHAAAVVGVGPEGTQQAVAVVVPEAGSRTGRGPLADPGVTAELRAAAGVGLAAVLTVPALPVDIRHASKVDRTRLARWASRVLSGDSAGRP